MDELERRLLSAAAEELQHLFCDAANRVCGPALAHIWNIPKERVRPTQDAASGADLLCHAPATLWRRLRAVHGEPVELVTESEYGLHHKATYESAADLAAAILREVPTAAAAAVASDMRVREADGALLVITTTQLKRQRVADNLLCSECGRFYAGERGLRDHQQIKHEHHYGIAKQAVRDAQSAIMPFSPHHADQWLMTEWARRTEQEALARNTLSPGLRAARDGEMHTLVDLIGSGWDPLHDADRHGSSALMWAAGGGHVAVVAYLVESCGVPAAQAQKKDGRTALHWAARNGHVDVCRWLCSRGVSPDVCTHDLTRPLHWAVWQGQLAVCDYLVVEAKADLHACNSFGCNAVQWAAQCASGDDVTMCRWLLEAGLDIRLLNSNGHSALHKAAVKGHQGICEWLLTPDEQGGGGLGQCHLGADGDGNTPASMAMLEGHAGLGEFLGHAEQARGAAGGAGAGETRQALPGSVA